MLYPLKVLLIDCAQHKDTTCTMYVKCAYSIFVLVCLSWLCNTDIYYLSLFCFKGFFNQCQIRFVSIDLSQMLFFVCFIFFMSTKWYICYILCLFLYKKENTGIDVCCTTVSLQSHVIQYLSIHSKITMAGNVIPYYTVTALVPTLK